jgi:hypothetical protein
MMSAPRSRGSFARMTQTGDAYAFARRGAATVALPGILGYRVSRWTARNAAALGVDAFERAVDATAGAILDGPALERVLARLEAAGVAERIADAVLRDGMVEHVAARVLKGPELARLVELGMGSEHLEAAMVGALESPGAERLLARAVESPAMERLVAQVIQSQLLDETFQRLLESPELWVMIEEIARSPAVTEAITQQSLGFADQVAVELRRGSSGADEWLERTARRVRWRRGGGAGGPVDAPA